MCSLPFQVFRNSTSWRHMNLWWELRVSPPQQGSLQLDKSQQSSSDLVMSSKLLPQAMELSLEKASPPTDWSETTIGSSIKTAGGGSCENPLPSSLILPYIFLKVTSVFRGWDIGCCPLFLPWWSNWIINPSFRKWRSSGSRGEGIWGPERRGERGSCGLYLLYERRIKEKVLPYFIIIPCF